MSKFQLLNGEYFSEDDNLISVTNRSFCYGDGFFESMRISNGTVPFVAGHWQRLKRVCAFLKIDIPSNLNLQTFNHFAVQLATKNGHANARIRFQGFRIGSGRYAPDENKLGWSMICQPMETSEYVLNKNGLHLECCTGHSINPAPQSTFKSCNSLPYVLGGMFAKEQGLDDCFLLDANGFIAEATGSNVFILKGDELLTPNLANGGVAGVMRSVVLQEAKEMGLKTRTALIKIDDVLAADECFLTNASRGIQWVSAVGKKRFYKRVSGKLTEQINRKFELLS